MKEISQLRYFDRIAAAGVAGGGIRGEDGASVYGRPTGGRGQVAVADRVNGT